MNAKWILVFLLLSFVFFEMVIYRGVRAHWRCYCSPLGKAPLPPYHSHYLSYTSPKKRNIFYPKCIYNIISGSLYGTIQLYHYVNFYIFRFCVFFSFPVVVFFIAGKWLCKVNTCFHGAFPLFL